MDARLVKCGSMMGGKQRERERSLISLTNTGVEFCGNDGSVLVGCFWESWWDWGRPGRKKESMKKIEEDV